MNEEIKTTVKQVLLRDMTFYGTLATLALCAGILPILLAMPGLRMFSPALCMFLNVLILAMACFLVFFGSAFLLSDRRSVFKVLDLQGLSFPVCIKLIFATILIYVILSMVTFGTVQLLNRLEIPGQEQPVVQLLRSGSMRTRLLLIPAILLLTPWNEELCFRFGILHKVEQFTGTAGSAIISALIFAVLHLNLQAFPALFLLGLWLVWCYRKTGSLLASIISHTIFNGMTILLIFCK